MTKRTAFRCSLLEAPKAVFSRSFVSGLAAPVMLFSYQPLDVQRPNVRTIATWSRVGDAMREAYKELERERAEASRASRREKETAG